MPRCSGRDTLCAEVLNDNLVSFPSWSSEDTQFVSSKKSIYEEVCYRVEDERYELDMVLELNTSAIAYFETVQRRLQRMGPDEQVKFRLNEDLGGSSAILQRKAIHRIYGEKAVNIIQGLQENPVVAVPLVLRRLKSKADEWREAQKAFNKIWRDQNEKNYLKSLDHQSNNFKLADIRLLRSRALINEISAKEPKCLKFNYPVSKDLIQDAADLLIHHIKRQTYSKEEKSSMKRFVRQWLQDLFSDERIALSEDEDDEDSKSESSDGGASNLPDADGARVKEESTSELALERAAPDLFTESEVYRLLFANNTLYVFMRLHHTLCQRLKQMKLACEQLLRQEEKDKGLRSESTAVALRLRHPISVAPEKYYSHFLELVRGFLDGNVDSGSYEDQIRELFGVKQYHCFTLDKVISFAVKQLHNVVSEDSSRKLARLWSSELDKGGAGGVFKSRGQRVQDEERYRRVANSVFPDSQQSENLFKMFIFQPSAIFTVELLDIPVVSKDTKFSGTAKALQIRRWSHYLEKYVSSSVGHSPPLNTCQLFLVRNVLRWIKLTNSQRDAPEVESGAEDTTMSGGATEAEFCQGIREKQWQRDTRTLLLTTFGFVATPEELYRDVVYWDNTEIMGMSENMCKLMYATGCESLFYRAGKLSSARRSHPAVSKAKSKRWAAWLTSKQVVDEDGVCKRWFDGSVEGLNPELQTVKEEIDKPECTPYRVYTKYRTVAAPEQPKEDYQPQEPLTEHADSTAT